MAEVAHAAGVSLATVSKVWNGRADVSDSTRQRVEELLRQQGYRGRRAWRQEAAGVIDVIFSEIDCAWEGEHLRGIEAAVHEAGVRLVVSSLERGETARRQLLQRLRAGRTDGAILATMTASGPLPAALTRLNVPIVALDPVRRTADLPRVDAANFDGARAATAHLLGLGHRRIGLVTGLGELVCSRARLDGFVAAHEEAGVPLHRDLVEQGDFDFPSGVVAGGRLLDRRHPPTAIFATSDLMALGVYEAARLRHVSIPDRLSVVGFDDLPSARWAAPPLTTVRQPLREMGRLAARTVLGLADGGRLDTQLVVRDSTAVCRDAA
ncbi:LacI family DNA-binding transcriptional regulator [Actinoplanes sp. NEAU-A12]|uniref:LacI family DNA-binding transcriptional regulator n=1 Tax=Actinoplanes sandaracinus TaxID=3045177 RepID=A0ABT6WKN0_9ACTN|nr:LacI family DNA-binding transcriptional regulator [Actinoplanes sandaracinus]MDI6100281.1 LacI family DNA-binding transcriptional regulator [Actinoplanes sandaracinus]